MIFACGGHYTEENKNSYTLIFCLSIYEIIHICLDYALHTANSKFKQRNRDVKNRNSQFVFTMWTIIY